MGALEARSLRHDERRGVDTTRKKLRGLTAGQVVPLAIAFAVVVIAARFWIEHRHVPHLLVAVWPCSPMAWHGSGRRWCRYC